MSAFTDAIKDGFREARRQMGVDFTVAGVTGTFRGVERQRDELLPLVSGGFLEDYSGGLEYLASEVTLAKGGKVTFDGKTFRIVQLTGDSGDPCKVAILTGKDK